MAAEEWRPVVGYEALYEVSSLGRVRSIDRECLGRDGRCELHRGKMLKPQPMKNGYLDVYLCSGARRTHRTVHRLVAEAFIGPKPKGLEIRHKDGNRSNNSAENLEYGTRSENLRDCYSYGGRKGNGKLFREDVIDIKRRLSNDEPCRSIAKDYGVHNAAIYHIRNGTTFAYITEEVS